VVYRSHYKRPQFPPKIDFGGPNYRIQRLMLRVMLTGPAGLCWRSDRPGRTPSTCVAWHLQHCIERAIKMYRFRDPAIKGLLSLRGLSPRTSNSLCRGGYSNSISHRCVTESVLYTRRQACRLWRCRRHGRCRTLNLIITGLGYFLHN